MDNRGKIRRIDNDYVFPGDGKEGHLTEPKRVLAKVIKDSDGVDFSLHTLRRTFITTAERLDLPYYALKKLLNHSMAKDVTSRYLVINVDRLREPMQRVTDELKARCGISSIESEQAHG